jgi:hypothetical protein
MSALAAPGFPSQRITHALAAVAAALRARIARGVRQVTAWPDAWGLPPTLSDRLLRDAGASDADIARKRTGVAENEGRDALANRGLTAERFLRLMTGIRDERPR